MVNLYVEGPDALKLCSHLAFNPFAKFPVDRAKHFAPCSYDGYVIGDGILFHLAPNELVYVGRAPAANWLQFHAETGGYDVKATRDERSPGNPGGKAVIRTGLSLPGPGAEREPDPGQAERRADPRDQVLQHGRDHHQGAQGAGAAPRHGRRAGPGDLGALRGARGDPRRHRRSRQGFRPGAGGQPRLRHQHAGVGLDSLAAAGRLHRRQDEGVPRVAARHELRGHRARLAAASTPRTSRTTT